MAPAVNRVLSFGEFSLHREKGVLLRRGEPVSIRRKLWDALCLLLDRRGTLVPIDDLREAVWRGTVVSEGSVGNLIYELRRVLEDPAAQPQYIETIPARGLRFIAAVEEGQGPEIDDFVGRAQEMQQLEGLWPRVRGGERQVVVVAGEPGIGKTRLIHRFLHSSIEPLPTPPRVLIGRCVARAGGAVAYLPVFDILDSWKQSEGDVSKSSIAGLLREYAPRWARQISWVARRDVGSALAAAEARPERMMREIAAVFESAAAQRPLVLVFEDLHWADRATIELLTYLTSRDARAQLLLLCTYRQAEALAADHPVMQLRLAARERLTLLDLQPLSRAEVQRCLEQAFEGAPAVADLVLDRAMRRSGGNPLLLRALARLLVDHHFVERTADGWRVGPTYDPDAVGAPTEIESLLAQQLQLLSASERELLEAASVAGEELDAAAVAVALGLDVEDVDTELRRLTLHASLVSEVSVSSWPDGATAGRFRFRHALYREILYRDLPIARRARLHRSIGKAIERGFALAPQPVIVTLAEHFDAGGDHTRAARYLEQAALQMIARSAIHEAAEFFRRALQHVLLLPDKPARCAQEVRVRTGYGLAAAMADGLEAPAVQANYGEVERLRRLVSDPDVLFPTLRVFWVFELMRFGYTQMGALNEQLRDVAQRSGNLAYRSLASSMMGTTQCFLGNLRPAQQLLEDSLAQCDDAAILPQPHAWLVDPRVETRCVLAWVLWLAGSYRRSRDVLTEAQRLAVAGRHESTRGLVLWFRSSLAQLDSDVAATRAAADQLQALAKESGMPVWLQIATIVRALADLTEGDATALEHGLESLSQVEGSPTVVIARAYLLGQLALAYGRRDEAAHGLALVDMALARIAMNAARVSEADLLRIRGELLEACGDLAQADDTFRTAIAVARQQGADTFELRAATARLRLHTRKPSTARGRARSLQAARSELSDVYERFAGGLDAHDVRSAGDLLAAHPVRR